MIIPKWEEALRMNNLDKEFKDAIHGLKYGFHQGIPEHRVKNLCFYTPKNHKSALKDKEKMEEGIRKEIKAKRIFGPFAHKEVCTMLPFFRKSPLGAVVNGDSSFRPIHDQSFPRKGLDNAKAFKITWDDFKIVASFLLNKTEPVKTGIFDWEKAYHQIPTAPDKWPYLMTKDFQGNLLLETGVAGCGSFGQPADVSASVMPRASTF
jgi:hypothetical protein